MERAEAQSINIAFQKLADDFAKEHGLEHINTGCTYGQDDIKFKVNLFKKGVNGADSEAANFNRFCRVFGLVKTDHGRIFMSKGVAYTLVNVKPKNHKYPIIGRTSDGRKFKFGADVLQGLR